MGGGICGMILALRLAEKGFNVTLIEASKGIGGLASPSRIGAYAWDRYYHVILPSDEHLLALLDLLELTDQIQMARTKAGFFMDGHLYSMSDLGDFLRFPTLSLWDKIRWGWTLFYASKIRCHKSLETVTATDWLKRHSGKTTFEKIWLPIIKSKFGENHNIINAGFMSAIISRMYSARRYGSKQEEFGYVRGGYKTVLDTFQKLLDKKGVEIFIEMPVTQVSSKNGIAALNTATGRVFECDNVILTIPCPQIAELCPQFSMTERQCLSQVSYQGLLCASLILKKPLAEYYITYLTDGGAPFTGVIEMTGLVDRACFDDNSLVYLPRYMAQGDPFWKKSDDEIQDEFLDTLQTMYSTFDRNDLVFFEITREKQVLPLNILNYSSEVLFPTRTSLGNVFVVNSAQITEGTMNVNETIGLGNRKAKEIIGLIAQA